MTANIFRRSFFYGYHQFIKRDKFYDYDAFLAESQFLSREKILSYQWDLFLNLIDYAYKNVPYYKQVFNNNGLTPSFIHAPEDLARIPVLTKDDVTLNFNRIKAQGIEEWRVAPNATSGSTGTNFRFLSDKGAFIRPALQKRCYNWMGVDFWDRKMRIWGAAWDVNERKKTSAKIKAFIKNTTLLSGYNLSEQNIENHFAQMNKFKPKLLISYPSIFTELVKVAQKKEISYSPHALQTGGEKLFPFQREIIEAVFKTKIFDFYGARDMQMIAQECEKHEGLHIMAENVLVEVIDDQGNPIEEGEGDLVITDLHNRVMPFIRYRIGDRAVVTKRTCDCGRGLPLLKEIVGRTFEIIEFPNGNKVGGTFWTLVLKSEPGIKDLQVVQKKMDQIQINYTPDGINTPRTFDSFIQKIHAYSGKDLKITFNKMDEIPLSKGGKFRFVISELNKDKHA